MNRLTENLALKAQHKPLKCWLHHH